MKITFICLLISFVSFSCKERDSKPERLKKDSYNLITDSFSYPPFEIVEKPPAIIPDSLGGNNLEGSVLLIVYLDSSGTIFKYDILKMKVLDNNGIVKIDYYNAEYPFNEEYKYPDDVLTYMNWINNYLHSIVFKRNKKVKPLKINKFKLMILLNQ